MTGGIALVGGNEFRPDCEPMDRALLSPFGKRPQVLVLPTAARENPLLAAENGIRHFHNLGAAAAAVNILNRSDAHDPSLVSRLERADLFYFAGGDPVYLLEVLQGSPAWAEMVRLWRRDRLIAGSSAGAMVLGGKMWSPGEGWRRGLGLLPCLAVLPHHKSLAARWGVSEMLRSLPAEFVLTGIDEATALMGPPWRVFGAGEVSLYRGDKTPPSPEVYRDGQEAIPLNFQKGKFPGGKETAEN